MGFGGVQGMITTLKNNKIQKSERKKLFDNKEMGRDGTYGPMRDHKKMTDYQRTVFMQELQKKLKRERNRSRLIWTISIVVTLLLIFGLPYLLNQI